MAATADLAARVGTAPACQALAVPRATFYRQRGRARDAAPEPGRARGRSPRALRPEERRAVLDELHAERSVDKAPREVYAALLDEGRYLCSVPTMYRLLRADGEGRERRAQLCHPPYQKPELLATAPNQVWSWDITKLLGPAKWTYFYLYVILDIFSRYVVGWMVAHAESAQLAQALIAATCTKQGIGPGTLTVHADRGSSMKSKPVALLLADLGITKTHSRPHVSNDNPFSESQFKTLKYRPDFPERFGAIQDARAFCRPFFAWSRYAGDPITRMISGLCVVISDHPHKYNTEHHHSGLGLLTPEVVHYGRTAEVLAARQEVLTAAWHAHPERFVRRPPVPASPPVAVWINPPHPASEEESH